MRGWLGAGEGGCERRWTQFVIGARSLVSAREGGGPVTELPACWQGAQCICLSTRPCALFCVSPFTSVFLPWRLCLSPSRHPAPRPRLSPASSARLGRLQSHSPAPFHLPGVSWPPGPRLPTGPRYWTSRRDGEVHLRQEDAFASQAPVTVHDMVMNTAIKYANYIALGSKHRTGWHLLTYIEYYEECRRAAKAFLKVPRALPRLRAARLCALAHCRARATAPARRSSSASPPAGRARILSPGSALVCAFLLKSLNLPHREVSLQCL